MQTGFLSLTLLALGLFVLFRYLHDSSGDKKVLSSRAENPKEKLDHDVAKSNKKYNEDFLFMAMLLLCFGGLFLFS